MCIPIGEKGANRYMVYEKINQNVRLFYESHGITLTFKFWLDENSTKIQDS